jgi:hypothetical protein
MTPSASSPAQAERLRPLGPDGEEDRHEALVAQVAEEEVEPARRP